MALRILLFAFTGITPLLTGGKTLVHEHTNGSSASNDEYATYYIVMADTSASYDAMHQLMYSFHTASQQEIDTMNRYYNKRSGKLILSETDEDELYRGEYFPRRYPSATLSIEYLNAYFPEAPENVFVMVAGIYGNKSEANAAVKRWKSTFPKIRTQPAQVYIGCMH